MEDVFRFVVIRAPEEPSPASAVDLANPSSQSQAVLAQANAAPSPAAAIAAAVTGLIAKGDVTVEIAGLQLGAKALSLAADLHRMTGPLDQRQVDARVAAHFGDTAAAVAAQPAFADDRRRVHDAVIAIRAGHLEGKYPLAPLVSVAQVFAVIALIGGAAGKRVEPTAIAKALRATLVLPPAIFPVRRPVPEAAPPPTASGTAPGPAAPGNTPTTRREELLARIGRIDRTLAAVARAREAARSTTGAPAASPASTTPAAANAAPSLLERLVPRRFFRARVSTAPVTAPALARNLTLSSATIAALDPAARGELRKLGLDDGRALFEDATMSLWNTRERIAAQLGDGAAAIAVDRAYQLGIDYYTPRVPAAAGPGPGPDDEPPPPKLPDGQGRVQGVGWADLKIVRQQLVRYEATEIAHVENVLASETRSRTVRRTKSTEETTLTETETTTQEERDLQTTDRFELKREVAQLTKEDSSLTTGLTISAHYGSFLDVTATVGYQLNRSKEESVKQAATYAKEVTTRAASKITERVRQQRTRKVVETFSERDLHEFTNTSGPDIVGIYQWLDKVYEAQVFNYGTRFLFDLTVPEPAAFLIDALMNRSAEGESLPRPLPFTLQPQQLSEEIGAMTLDENGDPTTTVADYRYYVSRYQVTGVMPPPAPEIIVSQSASSKAEGGGGEEGEESKAQPVKEFAITIPDTHVATEVMVRAAMPWTATGGDPDISVFVGGQAFSVTWDNNGEWLGYLPADAVSGNLAVAVHTNHVDRWVLTVQVRCKLTPRAMEAWKLSTHAAILGAYLKLQSDYEDRLEAARLRQSPNGQWGSHPEQNLSLMRSELKKACLSVITRQHFGWLGAIDDPSLPSPHHAYPQVNLAKTDPRGSYIRFFEQAFEWEHMVFMFYPYFWGRKSRWYDRVLLNDNDANFGEFLRAGAARVVLAVRPGFEQAVAHYLDSGDLWDGSEFVNTSSPLYLPISEEIKAAKQGEGEPPQPEGDPWEVRVPTTLVKLRNPPELPVWIKIQDSQTNRFHWRPARWDAQTGTYVEASGP